MKFGEQSFCETSSNTGSSFQRPNCLKDEWLKHWGVFKPIYVVLVVTILESTDRDKLFQVWVWKHLYKAFHLTCLVLNDPNATRERDKLSSWEMAIYPWHFVRKPKQTKFREEE